MNMPFGRYVGYDLDDIPIDYLRWVHENCDLRSEALADAIAARLSNGSRHRWGRSTASSPPPPPPPPPPAPPPPPPGAGLALIDKVVRAWHRQMTLKYHPDRGGTHDQMVLVNEGAELLKKLAGL